jgi:putative endonuclease
MKVFKKSGKPFKSGNKINTVAGTTVNPNTDKPAFTFEEDDSVVDQRICIPLCNKIDASQSERYWVYLVRTRRDHLYVGISVDPVNRMYEHNNTKRGAKSLRGQRPVSLVWIDSVPLTKSRALRFERVLKKLSHAEKEKFLSGDLPIEVPK